MKMQGAKAASKRKIISAQTVGGEVVADCRGEKWRKSGEKLEEEDRNLAMQG